MKIALDIVLCVTIIAAPGIFVFWSQHSIEKSYQKKNKRELSQTTANEIAMRTMLPTDMNENLWNHRK